MCLLPTLTWHHLAATTTEHVRLSGKVVPLVHYRPARLWKARYQLAWSVIPRSNPPPLTRFMLESHENANAAHKV